jgi:hypothetical protein
LVLRHTIKVLSLDSLPAAWQAWQCNNDISSLITVSLILLFQNEALSASLVFLCRCANSLCPCRGSADSTLNFAPRAYCSRRVATPLPLGHRLLSLPCEGYTSNTSNEFLWHCCSSLSITLLSFSSLCRRCHNQHLLCKWLCHASRLRQILLRPWIMWHSCCLHQLLGERPGFELMLLSFGLDTGCRIVPFVVCSISM